MAGGHYRVSDLILGIDPGYGRIGYGFLEKRSGGNSSFVSRGHGLIETKAGQELAPRLAQIEQELTDLIRLTPPKIAVLEELYFGRNITTGLKVAEARGVIRLCLFKAGIPVFELSAKEVKQGVCGSGRAEKGQVQQMVKVLLGLPEIPKPDDVADALAVGLAGSVFLERRSFF